jgi:hypothetical protein
MSKNNRRKDQDPVIGLISGRMVSEKGIDGKVVMVFKAFKLNPNPPLKDLLKEKEERFSEDEILVHAGLRLRPINIDKSCFQKTDAEKAELKRYKKSHKSTLVKAGFNPSQRLNICNPQVLRRA